MTFLFQTGASALHGASAPAEPRPAVVVDLRRMVPATLRGAEVFDEGFAPGDVVPMRDTEGGPVSAYGFGCPGCGARSILHLGTGPAGHTWHVTAGDAAHPEGVSLRASILHAPQHGGCGWHGYLTEGRFTPC